MSALEGWARAWLVEPKYVTVFKPTMDVVKDYLCTGLVVLASIVLAVNLALSLGSGPIVCFLTEGVSDQNKTVKLDVPPPAMASLVNYANFHQGCAEASLTLFMQYLPFVFLLQAAAIILIEKMLFKIPRVSGKIERFYGAIVEESLYGKDPDLAEDVWDSKANSEAISRQRRRNEVCMSLKRSSIIHTMYIIKNILEIMMLLVFIPFNVFCGLETEKNLEPTECIIDVGKAPELGLETQGHLIFRCNGKKVSSKN